jgi:hypothetical protein
MYGGNVSVMTTLLVCRFALTAVISYLIVSLYSTETGLPYVPQFAGLSGVERGVLLHHSGEGRVDAYFYAVGAVTFLLVGVDAFAVVEAHDEVRGDGGRQRQEFVGLHADCQAGIGAGLEHAYDAVGDDEAGRVGSVVAGGGIVSESGKYTGLPMAASLRLMTQTLTHTESPS